MMTHIKLRKAILVVLFLLIAGAITAGAILLQWRWPYVVGMFIIGILLFFNLSRHIYPVRRVLARIAQEEAQKEKADEKSPSA